MSAINVTWIVSGDRLIQADVPTGQNLMEAARANQVPGIVGECGGAMACATCHVIVEHTPAPLNEPSEMEQEMLELAVVAPTPRSRLSCQIVAGQQLNGIVLRIPQL